MSNEPDLEVIADQLRKPAGELAKDIGENMNRVNEPLYDLTLATMELQDEEDLLEIGFGTGKFFSRLFAQASGLHVSGVDYSNAMVEMARGDNRNLVDSGKLKLEKGNSDALPFQDQWFDKVFCNMVIYFWEYPEKHLEEIRRILKPGGSFFTGFRTRESMQHFPFVEHGFVLYSVEEWQSILEGNGFTLLHTKSSLDPPIDIEGKEVRLESYCIAASKD